MTTTDKYILFAGTHEQLIAAIARDLGCTAVVCQTAADYADERITDAINETAADDREPVDEAPFCDAWSLEGYDYLAYIPVLERRRDEILSIFKEEPLSKEQADALIEELAEIETRLD